MIRLSLRREKCGQRHAWREDSVKTQGVVGMCQWRLRPGGRLHKLRNAWGYEELEKTRVSPLEAPERAGPCKHIDFRLLAFFTVTEEVSVALSYPVCGILL